MTVDTFAMGQYLIMSGMLMLFFTIAANANDFGFNPRTVFAMSLCLVCYVQIALGINLVEISTFSIFPLAASATLFGLCLAFLTCEKS